MTEKLSVGLKSTMERQVEEQYCTRRAGFSIFSTPNLVLFVEESAITALAPFLEPHQGCVGSAINLTHVAPTLLGQRVSATVTINTVDRRRIGFDVEVRDEVDVISTGTHERFIIDLNKLANRLSEKAAKLG